MYLRAPPNAGSDHAFFHFFYFGGGLAAWPWPGRPDLFFYVFLFFSIWAEAQLAGRGQTGQIQFLIFSLFSILAGAWLAGPGGAG